MNLRDNPFLISWLIFCFTAIIIVMVVFGVR